MSRQDRYDRWWKRRIDRVLTPEVRAAQAAEEAERIASDLDRLPANFVSRLGPSAPLFERYVPLGHSSTTMLSMDWVRGIVAGFFAAHKQENWNNTELVYPELIPTAEMHDATDVGVGVISAVVDVRAVDHNRAPVVAAIIGALNDAWDLRENELLYAMTVCTAAGAISLGVPLLDGDRFSMLDLVDFPTQSKGGKRFCREHWKLSAAVGASVVDLRRLAQQRVDED